MALSQIQLLNPKEAKVPYSLSTSQTTKVVSEAYARGIMTEKPYSNPQASLEVKLKSIFPEKKTETRLQKARQIMGEAIKELSDEELESFITEFQYLIDAWVDSFEKQVFENKTLKQLLREG